jgi:hypothetical protein
MSAPDSSIAVGVTRFVTDGSETVGIGGERPGTNATENPYKLTLCGIGRYRLESPSWGSIRGHPSCRCPRVMGSPKGLIEIVGGR